MIPCGLSPSLFFLWKERTKETEFVTKIGSNNLCASSTVTAVDTEQKRIAAAFLPPSATSIERAKPPPADPDGGRFRECNQKGATNLFYHRTGPVSFVGFTNLYGL
jgi:hypothetical protein